MSFLDVIIVLVVILSVTLFLMGLKSQKGEAPGMVAGRLSPCSDRPNCVSSEAGTDSHKIVPPLRATLAQAKAAVIATGGTITSETGDYISATYMTKLFKFVDDVELRADGDVLQIRSGSRVGHSDNGVNRKRVATIRAALGANIPPEV